eukprot:13655897-Alexandrium_andersonii.AAC.1
MRGDSSPWTASPNAIDHVRDCLYGCFRAVWPMPQSELSGLARGVGETLYLGWMPAREQSSA